MNREPERPQPVSGWEWLMIALYLLVVAAAGWIVAVGLNATD